MQRLNDNHEHRTQRLHADVERQRRHALLETIGLALRTRTAETEYLGKMNCRCVNGGARRFSFKVKQQHPGTFSDCCNYGRFVLDLLNNFPEHLMQLFLRGFTDPEHRELQKNFLGSYKEL
ncbi:hypothetical protein NECAME_11158 [Necator americanus]|uniref:Uncharacterized protein n=1 Tax=Necator americanus TaxID=51031 RepID=W2T5K9_NECAM|nr:hypothetical protein NECAME_11158 [Necator americanus]ETN77285.1 hypothetical protein NECAME_11158 [Necator americanus]